MSTNRPSITPQHGQPLSADGADADMLDIVDDAGDAWVGVEGVSTDPILHWPVLIVDDDPDVHDATVFAVKGHKVLGRPVTLLHAYSAEEGLRLLQEEPDIAVAFVDVVMETENAGLQLVESIRRKGIIDVRLVLRTGQPGQAPELSVMAEYDINDYRTKAELTRTRLLTVLTAAVRSYSQIKRINASRRGLEMIVEASADLYSRKSLELFSRGVLTQIAGIMGIPANGLVAIAETSDDGEATAADFAVISDAGRFAASIGMTLAEVDGGSLSGHVGEAAVGVPVTDGDAITIQFRSEPGRRLFVYMETEAPASEDNLALLNVFSRNVATCFENIDLVERLDQLAFVDTRLGVPNANALESRLDGLLKEGRDDLFVVLVMLDEVEGLSGSYGPAQLDRLLREAHHRLSEHGRDTHVVARIGNDSFGLLLSGDAFDDAPLRAAFNEPITVDDLTVQLTLTLAVIAVGNRYDAAATVVRDAHAAIATAMRDRRGGTLIFDQEVSDQVRQQIYLRAALRSALSTGDGLHLHLQPKIDIESGTIVGAEALSRWTLNGKPVSPAAFVPIAEQAGFAGLLTERAIAMIGRWQRRLRPAELASLPIAVNLSMQEICDADFADRLLATIDAAGLSPANLQFEVTESATMRNPEGVIEELNKLKDAGYAIAIDDFGTGYSSLAYLQRLPISVLKIDRAFVRDLTTTNARRSLAATTIAMAQSLNMEIIAEGVETMEQQQALLFLGCRVCQGFLYARPLPMDAFDSFQASWQSNVTDGTFAAQS